MLMSSAADSPPTTLAEKSDNIVSEIVEYGRSNTIRNECQFITTTLSYTTAYMADPEYYICAVLIGTSSSGKSHLKGKVENLFPESHLYEMSSGTEKASIHDNSWDERKIVCMEELQQPPEELIEFLKGVHGGDEVFKYKWTTGSPKTGFDAETITRESKPYFFTYAQFDADFEMWNRLLKIPVHESESKNKAVGKMAFDHHRITIGDDVQYGFDIGNKADHIKEHIRSIPEQTSGHVLIPNGEDAFGWDAWQVMKPIFNHERSEANRIYKMVANLIRSSALINYHAREEREVRHPSHGDITALVAEPQDVANILRCREVLLATTHEIDRKKRAICNAIDSKGGKTNEVEGIKPIRTYLSESDAPMVKETEMKNLLQDLQENYLIQIHDNAGERGDIYEFYGWDELGFAQIKNNASIFSDCIDPITGDPFIDSHTSMQDELDTSSSELLQSADSDSDDGYSPSKTHRQQQTASTDGGGRTAGARGATSQDISNWNADSNAGSGTAADSFDVELTTLEQRLYKSVSIVLDGERITELDSVPMEGLLGIAPLDASESDARAHNVTGTVLDPTHEVWDQPDRADDWVTTESKARRELKQAIKRLTEKGVIRFEKVHEIDETRAPIDVTIDVRNVDI